MTGEKTNRLGSEASPYLQQHAKNPVDWYAWGPEALAAAKKDDKPILLSIGYSACHWCHVMERESFENEAIAKTMNELFVNVKVDREERPDLDQIYQLVVQLMGRSGGWPLTVFLTPEQKPFFGGTYFPPTPRYGMPGFGQLLEAIAEAYRTRRGEIDEQAAELTQAIASVTATDKKPSSDAYALGPDLLARASAKLSARFDDVNGGIGSRPKFPNTMSLDVLLRRGVLEKDDVAKKRVKKALESMAAGGIHDHLGGGFHRYSTDEKWLVPHFEKMLYDNSLLLRSYADGYRVFGDEAFATTARSLAAYVRREMTDAGGGFYATQDADSEGEEGKFFVWSEDEIREVLGTDDEAARVAVQMFDVGPEGNFEDTGKTVLATPRTLEEVAADMDLDVATARAALDRAKPKLLASRETRIKPFRDEKILASWNGLMISSLADAGALLGDASLIDLAKSAYAFVDAKLVTDGRVARHVKGDIVKGPGFLDDHAFVARAALDLYEATGDASYVVKARAIAAAITRHFADPQDGGFFFTPDDGETLIHRAKDPFDHAIPSGASVACEVLLRLGVLVDESLATAATTELERLAPSAVDNPFGMGQTVCTLDRLVRGSVDILVIGAPTDPRTQALVHEAFRAYVPNRTLARLTPNDAASLAACAALAEGKAIPATPAAYVCQNRTCSLPVTTPAELAALLR
jgi:uncharacterized protein YyaL (SSP411 family)